MFGEKRAFRGRARTPIRSGERTSSILTPSKLPSRRESFAPACAGMEQPGNRRTPQHQSADCETALTPSVLAHRNHPGPQASQAGNRDVGQGADGIAEPRDQLTKREIQVATRVWEGLTNQEIAKVIGPPEQVVKNCRRTAFDKLEAGAASNSPCISRAAAL